MSLIIDYTPRFRRDYKRVKRRGEDLSLLAEVIDLIAADTPAAQEELRRRHRVHRLQGPWDGARECHIANAGDWLLVWEVRDGVALLVRTGTHDEIFR